MVKEVEGALLSKMFYTQDKSLKRWQEILTPKGYELY